VGRCILIVDDDPSSARWILRELSDRTSSIGLVAESLVQAASFLEDKALDIAVVVTDFYFRPETHDERRELFDGLDLIQFAFTMRPDVRVFVVSAYAEDPHVREKIASLRIRIDGIFNRFTIGIESENSLWTTVTRGLPSINSPRQQTLYDIFLAYNSKDRDEVRAIHNVLKKRGMEVWFDDVQVRPGHLFQEEIERVLPYTKAFGICIGASGVGPWERLEIRTAIAQFVNRGAPVIPILLPSYSSRSLPAFLEQFRAVEIAHGVPIDESAQKIIWGVTGNRPADQNV